MGDLLENKKIMDKVYKEYPREEKYDYEFYDGKHACRRKVIYCDSETDIVRCDLCGYEKEVSCSFDSDFA